MLSTQMGRFLVALIASGGLIFTAACEPGTFDTTADETEAVQPTDPATAPEDRRDDDPVGGGPEDPWDRPAEEPGVVQDDGFEEGLNSIQEGLNEIRQEVQQRGDELGTVAQEQVDQLQLQIDNFEEEIRQDIETLRQMEGEPFLDDQQQPGMDDPKQPGMDDQQQPGTTDDTYDDTW